MGCLSLGVMEIFGRVWGWGGPDLTAILKCGCSVWSRLYQDKRGSREDCGCSLVSEWKGTWPAWKKGGGSTDRACRWVGCEDWGKGGSRLRL